MVPAESHVLTLVAAKALRPACTVGPLFIDTTGVDGVRQTRIAHTPSGICVFRERGGCAIHTAGGESGLPVSCRHYPRVILRDGRGTLISMSHYCPTAASLLFEDVRPSVVRAAGRLTIAEPVEGLDARDALPPLLRPGMLTDLEGYSAWEGAAVDTFARASDASRALDVVCAATERVRSWTPADGRLADAVRRAFDAATTPGRDAGQGNHSMGDAGWDVHAGFAVVSSLANETPGRRRQRHGPLPPDLERAVARYLAARAFGNWISYQGRGLRTIVAWLHACHDVVRAFIAESDAPTHEQVLSAIRSTDFLMLHSMDSQAFSLAAIPVERSHAA